MFSLRKIINCLLFSPMFFLLLSMSQPAAPPNRAREAPSSRTRTRALPSMCRVASSLTRIPPREMTLGFCGLEVFENRGISTWFLRTGGSLPGPPNRCFLVVFGYIKASRNHLLGGTGIGFLVFLYIFLPRHPKECFLVGFK